MYTHNTVKSIFKATATLYTTFLNLLKNKNSSIVYKIYKTLMNYVYNKP